MNILWQYITVNLPCNLYGSDIGVSGNAETQSNKNNEWLYSRPPSISPIVRVYKRTNWKSSAVDIVRNTKEGEKREAKYSRKTKKGKIDGNIRRRE